MEDAIVTLDNRGVFCILHNLKTLKIMKGGYTIKDESVWQVFILCVGLDVAVKEAIRGYMINIDSYHKIKIFYFYYSNNLSFLAPL